MIQHIILEDLEQESLVDNVMHDQHEDEADSVETIFDESTQSNKGQQDKIVDDYVSDSLNEHNSLTDHTVMATHVSPTPGVQSGSTFISSYEGSHVLEDKQFQEVVHQDMQVVSKFWADQVDEMEDSISNEKRNHNLLL